ncbi:hypothetical protein BKA70DRAFT_1107514 [Coprinopsis sp. MPI-PUGE-AT-0042]|nr:hypothetical protein BKA70DRAFT_1107514 [Coprinopsis sp. MPI-PUGE-AT-0042]
MKTTFANDLHDYMVRFTRHVDSNVPSLPLELVCNIMSYLDCLDLLQCQLVCKIFRKLILETSRLSYTIDLHKYRMVSIISSSSSLQSSTYNSRLALLRERERNWRMLGWRTRCTVDLPPTGSLYEFVGGVYANGREGENRITASISFLELPSTGMVVEKEKEAVMVHGLTQWTHLMPDYNIIDFTMDPVQDLLVLVVVAPPDSQHVYDLHIRSIKTNQPHPLAPKSIFPCLPKPNNQPHPFDVVTAVRVQVCGHLVALLIKEVFDNSGGYLEIWNWTFGPTQSCRMPRAHGIDDFTFLTSEVCLVVRPTGRFEVYDFWDPKERSSEPVLRYAFAFPPLSAGYTYWYISLSSNPTPGWVPHDAAPSSTQGSRNTHNPTMEGFLKGHQQIHYPSPEERVHACCLYVFNPADPVLHAVSSFVFFIKIESLLSPSWHWFSAWEHEDDRRAHKAPYYNPTALERRRREEGLPPLHTSRRPSHRFHEADDDDDDEHRTGAESLPPIDIPVHAASSSTTSSSSSSSSSTFTPGQASTSNAVPVVISNSSFTPLPDDFFDSIPTFTPVAHWNATHPTPSTSQLPPHGTTPNPSNTTANTPSQNPDPATCEPIPWTAWGPQNTRWFEECLSTDWQHAIYGMRAVESVEVSRLSQERQFRIHEWPVGGQPGGQPSGSGPSSSSGGQPPDHTQPSSSSSSSSYPPAPPPPPPPPPPIPLPPQTPIDEGPKREKRFLRVRDFSPYALTRAARLETKDHPALKNKGKCRAVWRTPKIIKDASRVYTKGVFKEDIMSSLPYVETVTDETFDVTDVMMDDCRLLLLKVSCWPFPPGSPVWEGR